MPLALTQFARRAVARTRLAVRLSFLAAALCAEAFAQSGPPSRIGKPLAEREPIIVGATSDSFPYGYVNARGEWTGFAVDLFDAVARVMNIRIRREVDTGMGLHARFRAGEFDVLQTYSQTPERDAFTDFSVPYLTLQGCIFVRKGDTSIRRVEDFHGREFAIIGERSIGEKFLRDRNVRVKAVYVSSSEDGLRLVESGRCAGVFVSYLTAVAVVEATGLRNVERLGDPFSDYDIRHCIAVHKGDAQLLARINEGLAILHRTGEYRKIYDKWFGRFESPIFTREQVIGYAAVALGLALVATTIGLLHQRNLRRRITRQAAELTEKEALLQALYDNIPLGMIVLEEAPAGVRILTLNRQCEGLLGVGPSAGGNRLLKDIPLGVEWRRHLDDVLRRWPSDTSLVREEHKLSGARKQVVLTLIPLAPGASGERRLCVLVEDVTHRRELDEEISQSRKLRAVGELVGGIAHEFNNLLTPVMLQLGEIQTDWAKDKALQSGLDVIGRAMQRAAELTRRLLTFGRRAERRSEPVFLGTVVAGCLDLLRQTVDRRIALETSIPDGLAPLYFNSTDLHQVLLNLLLNARDTLTEKIGRGLPSWRAGIRVEAVELPLDALISPVVSGQGELRGWQRLTVRDNGMGIPAEVKERIFEPFYTTKEVGAGTGLGLATVWHVVTDAGGRVEVESVPGEGSAFHVYLPVWSLPQRVSATPFPIVPPQLSSGARMRIFLADDEELVATTVSAALKRLGHEIVHRPDGQTAWHYLQSYVSDFQLLIFDVNMPGIDGIELSRRVRRELRYAGKLIIISGRLSSNDLNAMTDASVDAVLPKPFTAEQLLQTIERTCTSHAVLRPVV